MLIFQMPIAATALMMALTLNLDSIGLSLYGVYLIVMIVFWMNRRLSNYRGTDLIPMVFGLGLCIYYTVPDKIFAT